MARGFVVPGATLVRVKGSSASGIDTLSELGLTSDEIRVSLRFAHTDLKVNDYGDAPPDVKVEPLDATIRMTLVHYDRDVLRYCVMESMGGATTEGTLVAGGRLMGGYNAPFEANCHFISLNLVTENSADEIRFRAAYLTGPPVEIPIGTKASLVSLTWRAIPYASAANQSSSLPTVPAEIAVRGAVLYDRNLD